MTNPQKDEIHMSASHWASNSSQTHLIEGDSSRLDPAVNLSRRSNVGSVGVPPPEGLPTPRNLVPVSSLTDDGRTLGIPATRRLLTWKERAIATICLLSFGAAVVSVAVGMIAVRMGQKYQLVLLGFSLSVMAYCARKELLYLLVCIETNSRGKSGKATTLQHLAALLCYDPWSDSTSFRYRLALLATIALPLGLSAAYRLFQGGQSSSEITSDVLNFGLTGAPGEARHSAHSFWHYGLNIYVVDDQTTAMLDAPLPSDLGRIQAELEPGESCHIEAIVRAVVCTADRELSEEEKVSRNDIYNDRRGTEVVAQQFVYTSDQQLGIMISAVRDYTTIWMSWWSVPVGQSFGSEVRMYSLTRQMARSRWTVTPESVSLTSSTSVKENASDLHSLEDSILAIPLLFTPSLTEYNYRFRDQGLSKEQDNTKYSTYVRNDATILASAVWARMTALVGNETGNTDHLYTTDSTLQTMQVTLQRHWALFLVLVVQPAIMLTAIAIRLARYKSSPVGEDFGLVSLLAAADPSTLTMLDGAGHSGNLRKPLAVKFLTEVDPIQGSEHDDDRLK